MKKILFSFALVALLGLSVNAQVSASSTSDRDAPQAEKVVNVTATSDADMDGTQEVNADGTVVTESNAATPAPENSRDKKEGCSHATGKSCCKGKSECSKSAASSCGHKAGAAVNPRL